MTNTNTPAAKYLRHIAADLSLTECERLHALSDWDLTVSFLHFSGDHRGDLTSSTYNAVYSVADGYGKMPVAELQERGCMDWSHIRDSSEAALKEVAHQLRLVVEVYAARNHGVDLAGSTATA